MLVGVVSRVELMQLFLAIMLVVGASNPPIALVVANLPNLSPAIFFIPTKFSSYKVYIYKPEGSVRQHD